jgi:hypothetical protein
MLNIFGKKQIGNNGLMNALANIRREALSYFDTSHWLFPMACTLTLKKEIGSGAARIAITPIDASQNLRHFLNKLNKRLYGNLFRTTNNFRARLEVIPVIENDTSGRLHFHIAMDMPEVNSVMGLEEEIKLIWRETYWGYDQIHLAAMLNDGWIRYMLKYRSKQNFCDSIDWPNLYLKSVVV